MGENKPHILLTGPQRLVLFLSSHPDANGLHRIFFCFWNAQITLTCEKFIANHSFVQCLPACECLCSTKGRCKRCFGIGRDDSDVGPLKCMSNAMVASLGNYQEDTVLKVGKLVSSLRTGLVAEVK